MDQQINSSSLGAVHSGHKCDNNASQSAVDSNCETAANSANNKSYARVRWKILSKALQDKSYAQSDPQLGSIRNFSSFRLILFREVCDKSIKHCSSSSSTTRVSSNSSYNNNGETLLNSSNELNDKRVECEDNAKWFECVVGEQSFNLRTNSLLEIRFSAEKIPLHELIHGFDNTGNICIWPSEEVLAYYLYKNRDMCVNKVVLELGGGMTCLCGLMVAAYSCAKKVILTDGNQRSIDNIEAIVERNVDRFNCMVSCRPLEWGNDSHIAELHQKIDVIVCSDCLYFDGSRQRLVDTIWKLLHNSGIAILLAPTRGESLRNFVDLAKEKFFCQQLTNYDNTVWELHQHFLNTLQPPHYVTDLHYPYMILLRKRTQPH